MYEILFQSVQEIFKNSAVKALKRIGIFSLRDLIFYKPYSYNIIDIDPNLHNAKGLIMTTVTIDKISTKKPIKIYVSNNTGSLILIFFNKIPVFIFNKLKIGTKHTIYGTIQNFGSKSQMSHPEFILNKRLISKIEPIYKLTYGISNKQLYSYIIDAIQKIQNQYEDGSEYIGELINDIRKIHLLDIENADDIKEIVNKATIRLAKKELFANQLSLKFSKISKDGFAFKVNLNIHKKILDNLGYQLTPGQKEVLNEIQLEQSKKTQMIRLLQGDVGSGKTLVAVLTSANVVDSDMQVALMTPTDLLSNQHFQFFQKSLINTNVKIALLTGKISPKKKQELGEKLKNGEIDILIGTHSLFQKKIEFANLGFIIIDEQHKFGVKQRLALVQKGNRPDVLVMTATPIPRSLVLVNFGNIKVSQIKDRPNSLGEISTTTISSTKRVKLIDSLEQKIQSNERIYWVCPLIDRSECEDLSYIDVTTRAEELSKKYPTGILHGNLKSNDKESVMNDFRSGKIKILVTTTVIEVGIDVRDATLMIIENAERFGLAQLHQLRGRVGRGNLKSDCILLYEKKMLSDIAYKRLKIMREARDGFYIARKDLQLRGGGEILGTEQSGEQNFFFANLARDEELLLKVNDDISHIEIDKSYTSQIKIFSK